LTKNSNNTNINPVTVVFTNYTQYPLQLNRKRLFNLSSRTQKCLLLFVLLSIILTGVVIGCCFRIVQLRMKYDIILKEQAKNKEILRYLKYDSYEQLNTLLSKCNQTIQQPTKTEQQQSKLTIVSSKTIFPRLVLTIIQSTFNFV
jgi:hypothetical protein